MLRSAFPAQALNDSWTRASPSEVAAPAARPLHRGRRSREARCRRWNCWHSQVSRFLADLMPCIPFAYASHVCCPEEHHRSVPDDVSHAFLNVREFAGEEGRVELACLASRSAAVASAVLAVSHARSLVAACSLVARAVPAAVAAPAPTAGNVERINQSTNSASLSVSTSFKLLHLNPRGLRSNLAQVSAWVESLGWPQIVGFTETWSQRSSKHLPGYHFISQLDRRNTDTRGGGIALYALNGYQQNIAHLADSDSDERSWFVIHADSGPILLCLWYRRPDLGETQSIFRLTPNSVCILGML